MSLNAGDLQFVEQIAELEHPFSELLQKCGGFHDEASRRRWALAHIAARAQDEASIRWILSTADDGDFQNNDVLVALVRNPATPDDVVIRLAWNRYIMVSELAASDPRVPADVLERLAVDGCTGSRMGAAVNHNTPPAVRAALAADPSEWVRPRVAAYYDGAWGAP